MSTVLAAFSHLLQRAEAEIRLVPLVWTISVRLTRKILPYCAPSLSTSSAGTGPNLTLSSRVPQRLAHLLATSLWWSHLPVHFTTYHAPLPLLSPLHSTYQTSAWTETSVASSCSWLLPLGASDKSPWDLSFKPFFSKTFSGSLSLSGWKFRFTFISNKGSDCYPWKYVHHHIRWEWNLTWLTLTGNCQFLPSWYQQK